MEDLNELRVKIYKLQNDVGNKVNNLNQGGCIHFAYYFKKALAEHNIPSKVVLCDDNVSNFDSRIKKLDSFSHIMIYVKGIGYIDGYKTIPNRKVIKTLYKYVRITDKVNLDILRNRNIWNHTYKKSNNTKLEKLITLYI